MILVRIALEFMTLDLSFLLDTPCPLDGWELLSATLSVAVFATKDQHLDSAHLDSFLEGAQGDRSSFQSSLNPEQDLPAFSAVYSIMHRTSQLLFLRFLEDALRPFSEGEVDHFLSFVLEHFAEVFFRVRLRM